jgi:hypothetical protein
VVDAGVGEVKASQGAVDLKELLETRDFDLEKGELFVFLGRTLIRSIETQMNR